MRAALARLLLQGPALLLLDEPTNHLDLESLGWLENYLDAYDGTVVVVSHDRYFLNRMVTTIAELSPTGLDLYPGDYDDYLAQREARQALLEARAKNQAKRVAEIERFIERFRYKASKARQVQSRIKMLDRLDRVEVDGAARQIRFAFPAPPRTGRHVVQLRRHREGLRPEGRLRGDRPRPRARRAHRARRAERRRASRRSSGSSRACSPPDGGERILGAHVTTHYYAQHQLDALDPARTVLEEMEARRARDRPHPAPDAPGRVPLLGRRRGQARRRPLGRREGAARPRADARSPGAVPVSRRADEPPGPRVPGRPRGRPRGLRRDDGLHLARPLLHQPPGDEGRRGPGRPPRDPPRRVRRLSRRDRAPAGRRDGAAPRSRRRRERGEAAAQAGPDAPRPPPRRRLRATGRAGGPGSTPPCASSGGASTRSRPRSTRSRPGWRTWGGRSPTPRSTPTASASARSRLERQQAEEQVAWLLHEWETLSESLAAHE